MKQTIEAPWSVGDIGWAILKRTVRGHKHCDTCGNTNKDEYLKTEVLECEIDVVDIRVDAKGITYWYRVGFDIGESVPNYDSRFTYGTGVPQVYATREEAEKALKEDS